MKSVGRTDLARFRRSLLERDVTMGTRICPEKDQRKLPVRSSLLPSASTEAEFILEKDKTFFKEEA